jgi:hypothetical protein
MKNKFETAAFLTEGDTAINGVDRIYSGNEFCENLIPTLASLKKNYLFARSICKEFTFVTPFVTNAGLKKLERLLGFLNDQDKIEVVFNDWGVLKLIKERFNDLEPVLGRLLTKQHRDPRMVQIFHDKRKFLVEFSPDKKDTSIVFPKKIPRALFEHYQASVINLPLFQEYLLGLGIKRLEIDNLPWEMDVRVNKKIGVSIYLPYGYVTASRMCGKLTLTYAACKKECKKYFLRLRDPSLPAPFYGIGNAIFYESKPPSDKYLTALGIDRIVRQMRLPY